MKQLDTEENHRRLSQRSPSTEDDSQLLRSYLTQRQLKLLFQIHGYKTHNKINQILLELCPDVCILIMRRVNDLRRARERRGKERGAGRRSVAVTVDCPVIQVRLTASRLRGRACGGSSSSPAYLRLCVKDTRREEKPLHSVRALGSDTRNERNTIKNHYYNVPHLVSGNRQ